MLRWREEVGVARQLNEKKKKKKKSWDYLCFVRPLGFTRVWMEPVKFN